KTLIQTTPASTRCAAVRERPIRRRRRSSDRQPSVEMAVAARQELQVNVDKPVVLVLNRQVPEPALTAAGAAAVDAINYPFKGASIMKIRRRYQHRFSSRSLNLFTLIAITFGSTAIAMGQAQPQLFSSPEEATRALVTATQAKDQNSL